MNKKMIVSGVLAALMMGGLSGVQAAPSLEDHETRIVKLENLTDKIDDRSETDHAAIRGLKQNKADKVETEKALKENKDLTIQEIKDRKSANRKLNKLIKENIGDIAENKKGIEANNIAINNQISNIRFVSQKVNEHDVAINNQVANIRQSFELIKENKTGIEANKTAIAALDKKLTGADVALGGRIDQLATDTDKGLAKASALAALHPLDFDPSSKLNFAVAGGFYNGENAVALGAFYRPNRNVMLSFGSSIAGGENAYNVGLSVKVGKGGDRINQSNTTISELYDLVGRLQEQVAEQQKKIEELQAK